MSSFKADGKCFLSFRNGMANGIKIPSVFTMHGLRHGPESSRRKVKQQEDVHIPFFINLIT